MRTANLFTIYLICIISLFASCRNIPNDDFYINADSSKIPVSINILGVQYGKSPISANPDLQGVSDMGGG